MGSSTVSSGLPYHGEHDLRLQNHSVYHFYSKTRVTSTQISRTYKETLLSLPSTCCVLGYCLLHSQFVNSPTSHLMLYTRSKTASLNRLRASEHALNEGGPTSLFRRADSLFRRTQGTRWPPLTSLLLKTNNQFFHLQHYLFKNDKSP
jgi:hypothetical protein